MGVRRSGLALSWYSEGAGFDSRLSHRSLIGSVTESKFQKFDFRRQKRSIKIALLVTGNPLSDHWVNSFLITLNKGSAYNRTTFLILIEVDGYGKLVISDLQN